jgi:hypothetical protein
LLCSVRLLHIGGISGELTSFTLKIGTIFALFYCSLPAFSASAQVPDVELAFTRTCNCGLVATDATEATLRQVADLCTKEKRNALQKLNRDRKFFTRQYVTLCLGAVSGGDSCAAAFFFAHENVVDDAGAYLELVKC